MLANAIHNNVWETRWRIEYEHHDVENYDAHAHVLPIRPPFDLPDPKWLANHCDVVPWLVSYNTNVLGLCEWRRSRDVVVGR